MVAKHYLKKHLKTAHKHRYHLGLGLVVLIVASVAVATTDPPTNAAAYTSHATILVTGDYQGSTSATSIQHSFGTCSAAIGQLFTIQAGTYTICDGTAFGSPNGLYVYVPTAPSGFYVANWRVTGNTTNGTVSCSTSQCYLSYTAGTANLEVDIIATTRPTAPVVSVGGSTSSSVAFYWTAGSAGSAAFYDYLPYYNGGSGGVTQARSFNWTGLSCGQTVSMAVAIRTSAGNWLSNTASGRSTACALPPAPTPPPVAVVAPPASAPALVAPRPVATVAPRPVAGSTTPPATVASPSSPVIDSGATPTTPSNFQVTAASDNALVTLSWDAATGINSVQSYNLERSLDRTNWTAVSGKIVDAGYIDDAVVFGVHYYYRLNAVSATGKVSDYAFGDASTGQFAANSVSSDIGHYFSEDKVAQVEVPAGAMGSESAVCTVELSMATPGTTGRPTVAGPYALVCKTVSGNSITDLTKPATWTYDLTTKLKGYAKPSAVSIDSSGTQSVVTDVVYNAKTKTLQFKQSAISTTAVLASKSQGIAGSLITAVLVLMLVLGGGFLIMLFRLRKQNDQDYHNYLRRKYYDL